MCHSTCCDGLEKKNNENFNTDQVNGEVQLVQGVFGPHLDVLEVLEGTHVHALAGFVADVVGPVEGGGALFLLLVLFLRAGVCSKKREGLTHCALVTPYGDIHPDQHWLKLWLGAIRQQAITWGNVN